jgi:hypothetical protein
MTFESGNSRLLQGLPRIYANGTLSFTPREFQVGVATYRVRAMDSGESDETHGGGNASLPQYLRLSVQPINQQPSFVPVNVYASANSGRQELVFAVNVTPGGTLRYSELEQVEEADLFNFTFTYTADNEKVIIYVCVYIYKYIYIYIYCVCDVTQFLHSTTPRITTR